MEGNFLRLDRFDLPTLQLDTLAAHLRTVLREWRAERDSRVYLAILRAAELTRELVPIADCGLQKDVHKRIGDGFLSFNDAWTREINRQALVTRVTAAPEGSPLGRQLKVVFGRHAIVEFWIAIVRCSGHDHIVLLEARFDKGMVGPLAVPSDHVLLAAAERLHLSYLREYRKMHSTDWEKAVHELASPLDFIYTNSDFFIRYLDRDDISLDFKRKKLEDFKLIAELLIKRLHQFRFAFAGSGWAVAVKRRVQVYDLCMPITHLFYHDAYSKGLRFRYDELRGEYVETDAELFQFIVFNLVSNAIKYSDRGTEIVLYAYRSGNGFRFGVRNYGVEILDHERSQLFNLGYRSAAAKARDARGMGVGLAVCRQLARALGGSIRLLDDTGNLTVFELELPG